MSGKHFLSANVNFQSTPVRKNNQLKLLLVKQKSYSLNIFEPTDKTYNKALPLGLYRFVRDCG